MLRQRLLALVILGTLGVAGLGLIARHSAPAGPEPSAALANSPVAKMVGRWEGEASYTAGPPGTPPTRVQMVERAEWRLGRNAIVVEGNGEVIGAPADAKGPGHYALGIIRPDPQGEGLKFHAFKVDQPAVQSDLEQLDNGDLRWRSTAPGMEFRFTITLTDEEWIEIGEMRRGEDGEWRQFLEMKLKRAAP